MMCKPKLSIKPAFLSSTRFSVLAPSASFVETVEPFASFVAAVVMFQIVPQVQILVLLRLGGGSLD